MSTLFVADLHLCPQEPMITSGFLRFLQRDAINADALYILGDLFESWSGDDDPEPLYVQVATAIKSLQQTGVPCYFIRGNRDFLIGSAFAHASGMQLLPEAIVLELYSYNILIMHGDTLCTDDIRYQKFRRKVNNALIQKIFLTLPLCWRLKITARIRTFSTQTNQCKEECVMDVNAKAVEDAMLYHGVHWMIHGHTHRPAIHRLNLNNKVAHRAVLGAWHVAGSMITVSTNAVKLTSFPL